MVCQLHTIERGHQVSSIIVNVRSFSHLKKFRRFETYDYKTNNKKVKTVNLKES